tara:strand:+ start:16633 stop:17214 length:582 start_codon:yes stop_codon:yes gene_type:complete
MKMDKSTLIVMALEDEMPHLKENVLITGVGKINATFKLTKALLDNREITKVINIGTAGSMSTKNLGTVVRCTSFVQGDIDCEELGFLTTQTPNEKEFDVINFGGGGCTCSTQDKFVTKVPRHICDIVDMEAYSLAKVCKILSKEFYCYKFISDIVGVELQGETWESNKSNGTFLFEKILLKRHGIKLKELTNE